MPGTLAFERADVARLPASLLSLPLVNEEQRVAAEASDDLARHKNARMFGSLNEQGDHPILSDFRDRRFIRENRSHSVTLVPVSQAAFPARDSKEHGPSFNVNGSFPIILTVTAACPSAVQP